MRLSNGRDAGADRDRPRPCARTTWCILAEEHHGECIERARKELPRSEYGPKK